MRFWSVLVCFGDSYLGSVPSAAVSCLAWPCFNCLLRLSHCMWPSVWGGYFPCDNNIFRHGEMLRSVSSQKCRLTRHCLQCLIFLVYCVFCCCFFAVPFPQTASDYNNREAVFFIPMTQTKSVPFIQYHCLRCADCYVLIYNHHAECNNLARLSNMALVYLHDYSIWKHS